jgi:hypothetical protein
VYGRPAGKGFLRGVHHNVASRVPGPSFPYLQDADAQNFAKIEAESDDFQVWKRQEDRKKAPPPQKKYLPFSRPFPAAAATSDKLPAHVYHARKK